MGHNLRAFSVALLILTLAWTVIPAQSVVRSVDADDEEGLEHMRGWEVGDYWRYYKETAQGDPSNNKGSYVVRVQGVEQISNDRFFKQYDDEPAWKTHQVYRVKVWANQTANSEYGLATVKTEQVRYHRTDDRAYAQLESFSYIGYEEAQAQRQDRIYEYYPPEVEIVFPFAVGDKWRMGTEMRAYDPNKGCGGPGEPPCQTTSQRVNTYTVLGTENVRLTIDGKSKEFFTYRIHVLDERGMSSLDEPEKKAYMIWWYAPEACNVVKEEHYGGDRTLRERRILTAFQCAGKQVPDPSYAIYDDLNFSATRLHGELAVPPAMQRVLDAIERREHPHPEGRGGLLQMGENLPGPGPLVLAGVLMALAAVAQRRRDR